LQLKSIRSVLLIVAPNIYNPTFFSYFPPLGILYIAASLENNGCKVNVLDAAIKKMSYAEIVKNIQEEKPDLIGITCTTETRFEMKELTELIRKKIPDLFIVVGGAHVTFCPEETLLSTKADLVVLGEGDNTIAELISGKPFADIEGIVYRDEENIKTNPLRKRIDDLGKLPFPARHLIDLDKYPGFSVRKQKNTHINTNRGCPFGCIYCSASKLWGMNSRSISAKKVVEEVEMLLSDYGINLFYFYDDMFTANKKRAEKICNLFIEKKLNIKWGTSTRIDAINKDLLVLMSDAGCVQINYGVETLNNNVCKYIGRKALLNEVKEAVKDSIDAGIENVQLYILIGLPGDDPQGLKKTVVDLLSTQATLLAIQVLRIYPGTELERIARQKKILSEKFSWYEFYDQGMPGLPTVPLYTEQPRDNLIKQYDFLRKYMRFSSALRRRLPKKILKLYVKFDCIFFIFLTKIINWQG